ncbi:uncharacterized protein NEMAJ01_0067 [Nematocida major]|uniref:uncharacterized protein n=1 Tax=Nematocida major TaxID=1912982 RepID=UPI0020089423|nr:uncharacterized protein NEMAJ01_0067 [Nematocida major]KAH9385171.1 hypothetical protein NEMAJ01_0067 [Nematocida major]
MEKDSRRKNNRLTHDIPEVFMDMHSAPEKMACRSLIDAHPGLGLDGSGQSKEAPREISKEVYTVLEKQFPGASREQILACINEAKDICNAKLIEMHRKLRDLYMVKILPFEAWMHFSKSQAVILTHEIVQNCELQKYYYATFPEILKCKIDIIESRVSENEEDHAPENDFSIDIMNKLENLLKNCETRINAYSNTLETHTQNISNFERNNKGDICLFARMKKSVIDSFNTYSRDVAAVAAQKMEAALRASSFNGEDVISLSDQNETSDFFFACEPSRCIDSKKQQEDIRASIEAAKVASLERELMYISIDKDIKSLRATEIRKLEKKIRESQSHLSWRFSSDLIDLKKQTLSLMKKSVMKYHQSSRQSVEAVQKKEANLNTIERQETACKNAYHSHVLSVNQLTSDEIEEINKLIEEVVQAQKETKEKVAVGKNEEKILLEQEIRIKEKELQKIAISSKLFWDTLVTKENPYKVLGASKSLLNRNCWEGGLHPIDTSLSNAESGSPYAHKDAAPQSGDSDEQKQEKTPGVELKKNAKGWDFYLFKCMAIKNCLNFRSSNTAIENSGPISKTLKHPETNLEGRKQSLLCYEYDSENPTQALLCTEDGDLLESGMCFSENLYTGRSQEKRSNTILWGILALAIGVFLISGTIVMGVRAGLVKI